MTRPGSRANRLASRAALAMMAALAGCGAAPPATVTPPVALSPSSTPGPCAAGNAASTSVGAPIGATATDWQAAHGADPSLVAMCSTGRVVQIVERLSPAAPADASVGAVAGIPLLRKDTALAAAERLLPADQTMTDDVTTPSCRVLRFASTALATELGSDDPEGLVDVVLASAAGAAFHQQQIALATLRIAIAGSALSC